ncbi:MAG: nodulation protein NfeD [Ignavibacteria bacterium]|nr:nodulation protein NfeD [Ignavibacteria bacterium]MBT8381053.1 nodulation protein NfeD [Ignavibacteria bacterium]MBT8391650.1 nodulation protein NfeD [Ignavibacteria bacterium]NNJ53446.1 nodulation protein NfeD [Ignavibacteriaceae bacterium]NNL22425.1 nodulation protein NfeD [Ignavibacteriaceae bacterium]
MDAKLKSVLTHICLLFLFTSSFFAQQKVYVAYIEGDIDLGLAPYISRVIANAEDDEAAAIIFKINTFGGRVDAATQIKDAIIGTDRLTIAFINNRAISAGALIAISCNKIVMVKGSSIGAATVVDQTGEKVGEKYQSYMRSEMRSTAERNGRRVDIAEGMVDERIIVAGLVDSTQLITLTSEEAFNYGIADTLLNSLDEVLAYFELEDFETVKHTSNWAEDVVRFLNNPIISSILIMIGFFGLLAEIKSPGWGLPGTAGLVALSLFFGSAYILQLASIIEILLFIIGLGLILVEVFVIPGFGVAGISGIILIIASLFLAMVGEDPFLDMEAVSFAIIQLSVALLMSLVFIFLLAKYLPKSNIFKKFILSEEERAIAGYTSRKDAKELLGAKGIALTTLRPAGTAKINGKRVDVVTDSEYIENGKQIEVIEVEGMRIVVREIKDLDNEYEKG